MNTRVKYTLEEATLDYIKDTEGFKALVSDLKVNGINTDDVKEYLDIEYLLKPMPDKEVWVKDKLGVTRKVIPRATEKQRKRVKVDVKTEKFDDGSLHKVITRSEDDY